MNVHEFEKLAGEICSILCHATISWLASLPFAQACKAYEEFMFNVALLIRTDRGLSINETLIAQEVARVMQLEKELANVSGTTEVGPKHSVSIPTTLYGKHWLKLQFPVPVVA